MIAFAVGQIGICVSLFILHVRVGKIERELLQGRHHR